MRISWTYWDWYKDKISRRNYGYKLESRTFRLNVYEQSSRNGRNPDWNNRIS